MPQETNLNVSPYFDDFDKNKNFYRVLFKPGSPVQARELSTLQSILQNQIEQFGTHFFKEGSKVIPGNLSYDNNFTHSFLSLVSSISNIGISTEVDQANLNFIYILLVIIGGSFFSTSSGLRFLKIYSLTKYSINQILSFSRPKNVFMNKLVFSKINFDTKDINKYFLTILIFVISLFSLTILLSLSDIQFEYSFKLAILTLMNTVNSSAYGLSDFDFQNLHFFTKYFLIFFMIIGRVELLSLLLIAKKFLFKN